MAEDVQEITIKGSDVQALQQHLSDLASSLPDSQRMVLNWILERATQAPPLPQAEADVAGFQAGAPGPNTYTGPSFSQSQSPGAINFGQALGMGNLPGGNIAIVDRNGRSAL